MTDADRILAAIAELSDRYLHKRFGVSTDYLLGVSVPEYRINQ